MPGQVLAANECRTIRVRAGAVLTCTRGLLWLTFEPDTRPAASADRLASPGNAYVAPANGRLYLSPAHGHADAAFELDGTGPERPAWQRLLEAVGL